VDLAHLPLFDIGGMRIRQIKQPLGKMTHYGMLVQKFLVIVSLGQHFLARGAAVQRTLIREQ
jgi:hypothetical protein